MLERIRNETLCLLNEKGMSFTVAELAKRLAVSKRYIYEQFSSKNELVTSILNEILNDLQRQVQEIANSQQLGTIDKLNALMTTAPKALGPLSSRSIADIKRLLPEQWGNFERFFDDRWEEIKKLIEYGVQKKLFRPIDLSVLQQVYRGTINGLNEYQYLTRNNQTFHNAIVTMTDILLYGIIASDNQ